MLILYSQIGYPLFFILCFILWPVLPKKLKKSIQLKFKAHCPKANKPCILIHAASGEIEYAKPVIRELNALNLPYQILVTYSSPSFNKLFQDTQNTITCVLPFDFQFLLRRFFKQYQVKIILVARSDLWPNFLLTARQLKIPTIYFSVTQGKSKEDLNFFKIQYLKEIYCLISKTYVVSEADLKNLQSFLPSTHSVSVLGDTRFDQALYRIQNPKALPTPFTFLNIKGLTLTLGSTWEEDENYWIPALYEILKTNVKCIFIAPHEPTASHLKQLENKLDAFKLKHQRLSTVTTSITDSSIILIDQTGILAEVYLKSDLAFVGGSFKSKVHSVMEPLMAGLPICVGPFYLNNREAIQFSEKYIPNSNLSIVTQVNNSFDIIQWTCTIAQAYATTELKSYIQKEALAQTGASKRLASQIKNCLET
jgi:3-deoxy-D-manno-octulosonic-acid transferase